MAIEIVSIPMKDWHLNHSSVSHYQRVLPFSRSHVLLDPIFADDSPIRRSIHFRGVASPGLIFTRMRHVSVASGRPEFERKTAELVDPFKLVTSRSLCG